MAVVAPIPRASERMATIANPGFFPNIRNPYRVSSPAPHIPRYLLHQSYVPKFPPRRALRFFPLFAFLHAFPRRHLQMAPHFFIKLSLTLFSPPKTHGPPLPFLPSMFITLPAEARPRLRRKAATIWNVPCSVAFFPLRSAGKTLPVACSLRFAIAPQSISVSPAGAAPGKENRYPPAATRRNDSESPR